MSSTHSQSPAHELGSIVAFRAVIGKGVMSALIDCPADVARATYDATQQALAGNEKNILIEIHPYGVDIVYGPFRFPVPIDHVERLRDNGSRIDVVANDGDKYLMEPVFSLELHLADALLEAQKTHLVLTQG